MGSYIITRTDVGPSQFPDEGNEDDVWNAGLLAI
jgi:hypothetical protein